MLVPKNLGWEYNTFKKLAHLQNMEHYRFGGKLTSEKYHEYELSLKV